jgi:hypothetical protein
MVAVPPAIPITTPVFRSIAATAELLLLQVPPRAELVNVAVEPSHIVAAPVIAPVSGVTDTVIVAGVPQPVV